MINLTSHNSTRRLILSCGKALFVLLLLTSAMTLAQSCEYNRAIVIPENPGEEDDGDTLKDNAIIIDHRSIPLFESIPDEFIEIAKTRLVILPGESHGTAYGYGLELVENQYPRFDSKVNWSGAPDIPSEESLRWNRAYYSRGSWIGSCGEEDFWTNEENRNATYEGLTYLRDNYEGKIYFGFGWCWDMTWINGPTEITDDQYHCRWYGSTVGGPDGNKAWGIDDEDKTLTGNSVSLQTYLQAVSLYGGISERIASVYTTGPVDGYSNRESGYQRHLKHEAIREEVRQNGGILLDYADILSWDYKNDKPIENQWNGFTWNGANPDLATGGSGYSNQNHGGSHISEEACLLLGKAIWLLLAMDSGWIQ